MTICGRLLPEFGRDMEGPAGYRGALRVGSGVLILLVSVLIAGCTEIKFIPPSPEMRQGLGKIAVVSMPTQSAPSVDKPVSGAGSGALMGAGEAAVGGLGAGAQGCGAGPYSCALGLALGAAVAIVGAPIGAVVGAINAHSAEEVRAADANLRSALGDVKASEELANRVAAAAKSMTPYDLTVPQATTASEPNRNPIANGFNSALEITIADLRLISAGKIDPDVTLTIVAEVRLRHAVDGSEIYRRKWAYVGVPKNYFQMASGRAAMLRAEIRNGLDKLADRIVTDLFISNSPERQETSPRPGTVLTIEAPTLEKSSPVQNPPAPPPATATGAASSTEAVDVPFTLDLEGQPYGGVAKLENGHLAGQILSGNKSFVIGGEIRGNELSVKVRGAFNRRGTWDTPGNSQCSTEGSGRPASGRVTISMQAACSGEMVNVTIHLNLPPVAAG